MRTQDIEYHADGAVVGHSWSTTLGRAPARRADRPRRAGPRRPHQEGGSRLAGLGYACFAMDYHGEGTPLPDPADVAARRSLPGSRTRRHHGPCDGGLDVLSARRRSIPAGWPPSATASGDHGARAGRGGCRPQGDRRLPLRARDPRPQDAKNIKGKVLVRIGAEDPLIPPEQRAAFEERDEGGRAGLAHEPLWRRRPQSTNPAADSSGMPGVACHEATTGGRGGP